jgi:mRNA interferase RelE/StbE
VAARVEWRPEALRSARRFMNDQAGIRAVNAAIAALTQDPEPPGVFAYGSEYRRLRVGRYRILYRVREDLVTIVRVDRVS